MASTCSTDRLFGYTGTLGTLNDAELQRLRDAAKNYISTIADQQADRNNLPQTNPTPPYEQMTDTELEAQITQIQNLIGDLQNELDQQNGYAADIRAGLNQRLVQLQQQEADLHQKQQLVKTRDRMLQVAMEKNMYKRKLIYVLLSVILVIIVFLMLGYVAYRRVGGSNLVKSASNNLKNLGSNLSNLSKV
jgi:predicted RND superfamily exporter protein